MSWDKALLRASLGGTFETPEAIRQNLYGLQTRLELGYRLDLDRFGKTLENHSIDLNLYYGYTALLSGYTLPRALDGNDGRPGSRQSVGLLSCWTFRFSPGEVRTGLGLGAGFLNLKGVERHNEYSQFKDQSISSFDISILGGFSLFDRGLTADIVFLISKDSDGLPGLGAGLFIGTDIFSLIRKATK